MNVCKQRWQEKFHSFLCKALCDFIAVDTFRNIQERINVKNAFFLNLLLTKELRETVTKILMTNSAISSLVPHLSFSEITIILDLSPAWKFATYEYLWQYNTQYNLLSAEFVMKE